MFVTTKEQARVFQRLHKLFWKIIYDFFGFSIELHPPIKSSRFTGVASSNDDEIVCDFTARNRCGALFIHD